MQVHAEEEANRMGMDLVILGNGFDMAYDFKTSYKEFLEFCQTNPGGWKGDEERPSWDRLLEEGKLSDQERQNDRLSPYVGSIEDEFRDLLADNFWLAYFLDRESARRLEGKETWIDFEDEIYMALDLLARNINGTDIEGNKGTVGALPLSGGEDDSDRPFLARAFVKAKTKGARQYRKIKLGCLKPWVECEIDAKGELLPPAGMGQQEFKARLPKAKKEPPYLRFDEEISSDDVIHGLREALKRLARAFGIYCLAEIDANVPPKSFTPRKDFAPLTYVLSFNYTHTFEKCYANNLPQKFQCIYFQGEARLPRGDDELHDLVLGTKDKVDNTYVCWGEALRQFQKSQQRTYRASQSQYYEFLDTLAELPDGGRGLTIHIVGHSLGESDRDTLRGIFERTPQATIILYRHREDKAEELAQKMREITGKSDEKCHVLNRLLHDPQEGFLIPDAPAAPQNPDKPIR